MAAVGVAHRLPAAAAGDNRPQWAVHPDHRNPPRPRGQTHKRAVPRAVADKNTRRRLHPTTSHCVRCGPRTASAHPPRTGDHDRHVRQNYALAGCRAHSVRPVVHGSAPGRRAQDPGGPPAPPAWPALPSRAACSTLPPAPTARKRSSPPPMGERSASAWICSCSTRPPLRGEDSKRHIESAPPQKPHRSRPSAPSRKTVTTGLAENPRDRCLLRRISRAFISSCCQPRGSPCRARFEGNGEMT